MSSRFVRTAITALVGCFSLVADMPLPALKAESVSNTVSNLHWSFHHLGLDLETGVAARILEDRKSVV